MPNHTRCIIDGCHRIPHSGAICGTHRERMRRTGTYDKRLPTACTVADCTRLSYSTSPYCQVHHHRLTKVGSIDAPLPVGSVSPSGYRIVSTSGHILGNTQGAHRIVLFDVIGYGPHRCAYCGTHVNWKRGLEVDHVDHDKLNNTATNLVASCHRCNSDRSSSGRFAVGDARTAAIAAKSAAIRRKSTKETS